MLGRLRFLAPRSSFTPSELDNDDEDWLRSACRLVRILQPLDSSSTVRLPKLRPLGFGPDVFHPEERCCPSRRCESRSKGCFCPSAPSLHYLLAAEKSVSSIWDHRRHRHILQ